MNREKPDNALIQKIKKLEEENRKLQSKCDTLINEMIAVKTESNMSFRSGFNSSEISQIIDNFLDEVYVFDPDTLKFRYINNSALSNLGYLQEEVINLTLPEIQHSFSEKTFAHLTKPLLEGKKHIVSYELIHTRKNGSTYPIEANIQYFTLQGHSSFIAIVSDLSERKKQEKLLEEKNEELNTFFNCALDLLCIANVEGYFLRLNKEWSNVLGYSIEDLEGRKFLDFVHPDDIAGTLNSINQLKDQIQVLNFINRYRCKSGEYKWIQWKSYPVGEKIYAAARDITEIKQFQETLILKNMELENSKKEILAANRELEETTVALQTKNLEYIKAKELAESSENQFRLLVDNAPESIFIQVDYKFSYVNKAALKLYAAKSEEQLIGTEIIDRIHPDFRELVKERIIRLNEQKKAVPSHEYKHLRLNGDAVEVEVSAVPLKFNNMDGALVFVKDITERKLIEFKLQESYDLLKNLTAQVPGVVYQYRLYTDGNSAFPYSSPGMWTIYEVTPEEVKDDASKVFTRIHPEDFNNIVDSINQSARDLSIYHADFRVILPKQGLRWRHCDARPVLLADKSVLWHGIITDTTESKLAEEKITEQQLLFETMFNTISDAVILTDTQRNIVLANMGVQYTFGYDPGFVIGKSTEIFYADNEKFKEAGMNVFNEPSLRSDTLYLTTYRKKNGDTFPGETFGAKLFDSKGQWIGNLAIVRNISERMKYIEELKIARGKAEESDLLKTAFLHNISHEIRTPMNAIMGFSQLIANAGVTEEKRLYFADVIKNSCEQLLSIITDIINIATIEAGQAKIEVEEFNLNAILLFVHQQFVLRAEKHNIKLLYSSELPEKAANIRTDKTKLIEILTNIVGNAIKFTPEGTIHFGYKVREKELEFFVKDTGIGIPESMLEDIFKRFRQVESSMARQFGGSGLGLSISKAYVELLGGKIWASSNLNSGSEFFFTIPFNQVSLITESVNKVLNSTLKGSFTILIVEDEDSNYSLLKEFLTKSDWDILRATNGIEAVELCKSNLNIGLVLMDMKMPVMDGFEATKLIKEYRPELPIIAQTAYGTEMDKARIRACGCDDVLTKPIHEELFFAKLRQYI